VGKGEAKGEIKLENSSTIVLGAYFGSQSVARDWLFSLTCQDYWLSQRNEYT
jgi:hypothetical protein